MEREDGKLGGRGEEMMERDRERDGEGRRESGREG